METKWQGGLICRWAPFRFQFAAKQCAVEFFYKLYKLFGILLTACSLREHAPILRLSFHEYTSVGLVSCTQLHFPYQGAVGACFE